MVGHHAGREGVAGWGDEHTGELGVEEVRVCGDGVVELCLAEREQSCVLVRSGLGSCQLCDAFRGLDVEVRLAVLSGRAS